MQGSIGLIFSLLTSMFASAALASVETREFRGIGLESLQVKNSSGNVKVSVSGDGSAYVSAKKLIFDKSCRLKMNRAGKVLVVEVEKDGWPNGETCRVDFEIKVPRSVALNINSGSGDLNVDGTNGPIIFDLGSGDVVVKAEAEKLHGNSGSGSIKASGTFGDIEVETGSGSIDANGLTGKANLKTGSGDLNIKYKSASNKSYLYIETGSGDAAVYLPAETKVKTDLKSGSGRVHNELGESASASFTVSMKAGSGNLKIKKL